MLFYRNCTDIELIGLLKSGDEHSYTEIYNRYKGILYQHAYKKLGNQDEANDAMQELFTALWIKRENLDLKTNLAGYLYISLRNNILNLFARQQLQSEYAAVFEKIADEGVAITDHLVRTNMLQQLIEKEISSLPDKMREIFEYSRIHHMSTPEIADKLGITEKTVRNQIGNALKILRGRLGLITYLAIIFNLI